MFLSKALHTRSIGEEVGGERAGCLFSVLMQTTRMQTLLQIVLRPTGVSTGRFVERWPNDGCRPLLSGYGSLGSMGVMMPTLSSIAAAASRHRSSR